MSLRIYKAYTVYINKKLAWSIEHRMTLTPTTGKLIAKQEKAHKVNLLSGKLAIEERKVDALQARKAESL